MFVVLFIKVTHVNDFSSIYSSYGAEEAKEKSPVFTRLISSSSNIPTRVIVLL